MNKPKNDYELMLSTNLKELIKQKGVTITFVAKNTGVPLQTIHGWLQGSHPKNIIQIKKIASFFKKSVDDICFIHDQKNKESICYQIKTEKMKETTVKLLFKFYE